VRTVKKVYREQVYLNVTNGSKKGSESETAKIRSENNVDCIFDTKGIIHYEFVPEKKTVNGKFYKEAIKCLVARVLRDRPEFKESGSWYLLHDSTLAHFSCGVSEFWAKRGIPVLSHPPHSPDLSPADIFYFLN
jgi:hypothetical protein